MKFLTIRRCVVATNFVCLTAFGWGFGLTACTITTAQNADGGSNQPSDTDGASNAVAPGDDAGAMDAASATPGSDASDAGSDAMDASLDATVDADGGGDASSSDASFCPGPEPGEASTALGVSITSINASRIGQDLHLEVAGSGFGAAPTPLPIVGILNQFSITDTTGGGWCAGAPGCQVYLQYTSWADGLIVIDGFGTQYGGLYKMSSGDQVTIAVQGSGGVTLKWQGTLFDEAPPIPDDGGPTPEIAGIATSRIGPNLHLEVSGAGFGSTPAPLPMVGIFNQFKLTDTRQGWCAGAPGCPVYLQYTSWNDSLIVIDGFGPQYGSQYNVALGDEISIFVQNNPGPEFTVWTGTLEGGPEPNPDDGGPTPEVSNVTFSQVGQNMTIEVDGAGFGLAPTTLPMVGILNQFKFTDNTQGAWCAGAPGCPVYLQYTSWSDTRIVVGGFGPQYAPPYTVSAGDSVTIFVEHASGPEFTLWSGTLPAM